MITLSLENIVAGIVGIGGIVLALQKAGLITFGRAEERRSCPEKVQSICSDHGVMRQEIADMRQDIGEIKSDNKEMRVDIKELLKRNCYKGIL